MISNNRQVLVLQHAAPERLGLIAHVLAIEQIDCTHVRPDQGEPIPTSLDPYDGLIILGGPQSAYDEYKSPFLGPEKVLVDHAIQEDLPVLGVCLGSQILAGVLGARVRPAKEFELGWKKVHLSGEAMNDFVLSDLPREITPLHWHGDFYELPKGTKAIGSSELTPVQGFSWRGQTYGLLFHLEVTLEQLLAMVAAFPDDLVHGGMTPDKVLADAPKYIEALREVSLEVFHRWTLLL